MPNRDLSWVIVDRQDENKPHLVARGVLTEDGEVVGLEVELIAQDPNGRVCIVDMLPLFDDMKGWRDGWSLSESIEEGLRDRG
jgi:hypothetical protein